MIIAIMLPADSPPAYTENEDDKKLDGTAQDLSTFEISNVSTSRGEGGGGEGRRGGKGGGRGDKDGGGGGERQGMADQSKLIIMGNPVVPIIWER